jgi:hypothetical protein
LALAALPRAAQAQHTPPPPLPADAENAPYSLIVRAGGGADSNVLRDPGATQSGGLLRTDLRGEAEPVTDLRLTLDGAFEQDVPNTVMNQAEATLIGAYRLVLLPDLSLNVGSLTEYLREPSVLFEGGVLTTGAQLRTDLGDRVDAEIAYAIGPIDIEAGGRGELTRVQGVENYTLYMGEGFGGLRLFPTHGLMLRLRYAYQYRFYDGLPARTADGDVLTSSPNVTLPVQGIRATVRAAPIEGLSIAVHFDQEWLTDSFKGYLTGDRQVFRGEAFLDVGPVNVELAGEYVRRHYSQRARPSNDTPGFEETLDTWLDADVWINGWFGVYLRYQIERIAADPTGLVFFRQLVTLGPAVRLQP